MERASEDLDFERAAVYRDRISALADPEPPGHQPAQASRRPTSLPSMPRAGRPASRCSSSAPGRTGATAPISPRPTIARAGARCCKASGAVLRQQADPAADPDLARRCPRRSAGRGLQPERRAQGRRSRTPARRKARAGRPRDDQCPRGAGPRLAESASQASCWRGWPRRSAWREAPRRIEVYDNSHIMGTNAVGGMIVAGPEGFAKNQYRKFNIKDRRPHAGRRFRHDARGDDSAASRGW
jgi:excinuclease ABC subunit C